jgi:hypothetical protein
MKTSELSGAALDWAVCKAGGTTHIELVWETVRGKWSPSTDWAAGGTIVEREKISLIYMGFANEEYWVGSIDAVRHEHEMFNGVDVPFEHEARGTTPLEAAMRAYVTSKLGDEVQIPEGL